MNMTPLETRTLIATMVANVQQFGMRDQVLLCTTSSHVNKHRFECDELTTLMKQVFITRGQQPQASIAEVNCIGY